MSHYVANRQGAGGQREQADNPYWQAAVRESVQQAQQAMQSQQAIDVQIQLERRNRRVEAMQLLAEQMAIPMDTTELPNTLPRRPRGPTGVPLCAICQEEMVNDHVDILQCTHEFHSLWRLRSIVLEVGFSPLFLRGEKI